MLRSNALPNASLETHTQQLLRFHGELHRQFPEYLFAKTVDDHADGVLDRQSSLTEVEDLIFTYLRSSGLVLDLSGLARFFRVTVSSEEVPRGKPEPDVYLEAARGLGVPPERCAAVEDSHNGIRSAKAAGMRVIAIPNQHYPPGEEALALADVTLSSLAELTPSIVA